MSKCIDMCFSCFAGIRYYYNEAISGKKRKCHKGKCLECSQDVWDYQQRIRCVDPNTGKKAYLHLMCKAMFCARNNLGSQEDVVVGEKVVFNKEASNYDDNLGIFKETYHKPYGEDWKFNPTRGDWQYQPLLPLQTYPLCDELMPRREAEYENIIRT